MTEQKGAYRAALADGAAVGGVLSVLNPEGADLLVTHLVLDVTTASSAVATVDAGIDAAGDTSNDGLIDGLDVNTATGTFSNLSDPGTNGGVQKWLAGEYLVVSQATGAVAGLAGYAYIEYIHV